jgi:hypothetical protein
VKWSGNATLNFLTSSNNFSTACPFVLKLSYFTSYGLNATLCADPFLGLSFLNAILRLGMKFTICLHCFHYRDSDSLASSRFPQSSSLFHRLVQELMELQNRSLR